MKSPLKVNSKAIKEKLRSKENDKKKVSFYLSTSLYEQFKEACDDIPASQVLEELMNIFVESNQKKK